MLYKIISLVYFIIQAVGCSDDPVAIDDDTTALMILVHHLKTALPRPRMRHRFLFSNDTTCRYRTNSTLHGGRLHCNRNTLQTLFEAKIV